MKLPNRFRTIGICECDGEIHKIGLTRSGKLVPLNHTPEEISRWLALAEFGGRVPACVEIAQQDPCVMEAWNAARHDPSAHKLAQVMRQIGQVLRLMAFRLSAEDFPGQGKRNRRPDPPEPWRRPRRLRPRVPKINRWAEAHRLFPRWWVDSVRSRYRKKVNNRKLWAYIGLPKKHKKKVYYQNPK